jgi:type IV secretory pathway TraG/TraD family ATPase VirD4
MSTELRKREMENLARLETSDLVHGWLDQHPDGWDHAAWEGLLVKADREGFFPVVTTELGELLDRMHLARITKEPRVVRRSAASLNELQTVDGYGTAQWTHPLDFAERRSFEPGDFWLGRCPATGEALGHKDEMHILINGGTRGGKGTTVIIPNHSLWKGSMVSIDPKGENATVTAARRGQGNDVCAGMDQFVAVLDPLGCSSVDPKYRMRFNPLDALEDNDPRLIEKASAIADAIVIRPESEKDPFWNNKARSLLKALVLHVKTAPEFEGRRSMKTVYELAMLGDKQGAAFFEKLNKEADERDGTAPDPKRAPINPFDALFRMMKENHACGTVIPGIADEMLELRTNKVGTQWGGFRSTLADHLEFMESEGIQDCMSSSDFSLSDLKHKSEGMSLFLCLDLDDMETYNRWLRIMITLICYELRKDTAPMATGHRLLMCLDEFSTLGYLKQIEDGFSTLAGYDVKILVVVQFLQQLKKHYEKSWHTFMVNAGLRMFFAPDDETAKEVSGWIGETDITLETQSITLTANEQSTAGMSKNQNRSTSTSAGGSEGLSQSHGIALGTSEGTSDGMSLSEADGESGSRAQGRSSSSGMSDGGSNSQGGGQGRNFTENKNTNGGWEGNWGMNFLTSRFSLLRDDERRGKSSGSASGASSNTSWNQARSWQKSQSTGNSDTVTAGTQHTLTRGNTHTTTKTNSSTETNTNTRTLNSTWNDQQTSGESIGLTQSKMQGQGASISRNQSIQKRPLIYPHDLRREFAKLEEGDLHHPGLGLVMIPNENNSIVQRTLYFDDKGFDGLYDRHPRYPHTDPQPLIRTGTVFADFSDEAFWTEDDDGVTHGPIISVWYKRPGEKIRKGEQICAIKPGLCLAYGYDTVLTFHAPFSGTMQRSLISAGGRLDDEETPIADVEFYLPDLWDEADHPVTNSEIDRFIDGDHPLFEQHRRAMDARTALAVIPVIPVIEHQPPMVINDAPLQMIVAEANEPVVDVARVLHEMDEDEFKRYGLIRIPIAAGCLWIMFTALLLGLMPANALHDTPPVAEEDRPSHYLLKINQYPTESYSDYVDRVLNWEQERREFDDIVELWGGVKTERDVKRYHSAIKWRSRFPWMFFLSFLAIGGVALGIAILWDTFLIKAWDRHIENLSADETAIADAERTQWFYNEDYILLLLFPTGVAGFLYGAFEFGGFERIGGAIAFGLLGVFIGLVIAAVVALTRRVIWATQHGELIDLEKNIVPFNPKLSSH